MFPINETASPRKIDLSASKSHTLYITSYTDFRIGNSLRRIYNALMIPSYFDNVGTVDSWFLIMFIEITPKKENIFSLKHYWIKSYKT